MEKTKRAKQFCGSKTYSPQKLIAAGDTLIPHSSLLIPQSKKIFVDIKRKIRYNKRERNVRKIL
ncbi:hypothetical protein [uncultured Ruminococcus sp.]|jgi:hypothetical protein|uniref:hypothetical protein n=1 Tax=uncultured Ruminococcus sp. TaxID=165186 RepID=UPI002675A3AA|nr:hypothetical protein [uncultured Ruminococcus sp.]